MKSFKELEIPINPVDQEGFTGDKIKLERILNREITVVKHRIVESQFKDKGNGKRLDMQIKIGNELHVTWTGSGALMETIQKVNPSDFPFRTTIIKNTAARFQFT